MNVRLTNQTHQLTAPAKIADVFETVSVSNAAAVTLDSLDVEVPAGVTVLQITANAEVRYVDQTVLGTPVDPSATVGHVIPANGTIFISAYRAIQCKFIATGGAPATINITKLAE